MEKDGIIQHSSSPWASPLHMVPKSTVGEWRPCGDFCQLNLAKQPDRYPIPHLQDITSHLNDSVVFSKVDLMKAFPQIPMAPEDIAKTAITTTFGLYEFKRMPFRLWNAVQSFHRLMYIVLRDCDFVIAYMDDILVISASLEEHIVHLKLYFTSEKCVFNVEKLTFLDHEVSVMGVQPLQAKVNIISDFSPPQTVRKLREFLGVVNFYHRFIKKNAASVLQLLNDLLKGRPKRSNVKVKWDNSGQAAFINIKRLLQKSVILSHPIKNAQLCLATDAPLTAAGAILKCLYNDDPWTPFAFHSKRFSETEERYSTFD